MHSPIEGVIFDMDGLLLDTERVALKTYLETASRLRIRAATSELFETLIGRPWLTTQGLIEEALGPRDAARMLATWPETFEAEIRSGGIGKKPGVDTVLEMLETRRVPFALATSTARPLALDQLRSAGLVGRFPTMATGDEVEDGKPAPDIFLLAAERLAILPASCLALEDSEPGVLAASSAGMRVIMVPDLKQPTPEIAARTERVCESLLEVGEFLDSVLQG